MAAGGGPNRVLHQDRPGHHGRNDSVQRHRRGRLPGNAAGGDGGGRGVVLHVLGVPEVQARRRVFGDDLDRGFYLRRQRGDCGLRRDPGRQAKAQLCGEHRPDRGRADDRAAALAGQVLRHPGCRRRRVARGHARYDRQRGGGGRADQRGRDENRDDRQVRPESADRLRGVCVVRMVDDEEVLRGGAEGGSQSDLGALS